MNGKSKPISHRKATTEMVIISLKGSYTVTPAEPTPASQLWLSEADQIQPFSHAPTVYFYRTVDGDSVASAIETMRDSLSKALVQFYSLAGRLHWLSGGRLLVECNAKGAQLLEAESETKIDDFGDFRPTPEIIQLIPQVDYTTPIHELPLLLVQLTRFSCGGVSVGMALSHILADGQSALHFVSSWAKIARGEKVDTPPFLDRTVLRADSPPANPRIDHLKFNPPPLLIGCSDDREERKKETTVVMLKLTRDQIEKLKKKANEGRIEQEVGRAYSRYEAVAGHMWRCACKARSHDSDQSTNLRFVVDFGSRLQPPLPREYFGNAVFPVTATSRAGELLGKPLGYAASRMREIIDKMTDEYVRSTIDFLRGQPDLGRFRSNFHSVGCTQGVFLGNPNISITSWLALPIYDADFGWGKPIHMGPGSLGFDGKSFILPGNDGDGSFVVALRLQVAHVDDFKKFFYEDI